MVLSYQHQVTLTRLLQDYLVDLCREYLPFTGNLEIDGVVCLSESKDLTRQLVLKVHRTLPPEGSNGKCGPQAPPPATAATAVTSWPASWPTQQQHLKQQQLQQQLPLQPQGSLYGADAPQDLSIKEAAKGALTPLHALATSVHKQNLFNAAGMVGGSYGVAPKQQPAALQPCSTKLPAIAPAPPTSAATPSSHVASLLYQKIMEGNSSKQQTVLAAQNLSSAEAQPSPSSSSSTAKAEDLEESGISVEQDTDPALHNGEMLCKICSETVFGGFYGLQNHTYELHRRYVCKKCYSTFSLRCNLRRHERLHEGLKPYSCDSCDKTFSRSTDLRMHMQKHTTNPDVVNVSNGSNNSSSSNSQPNTQGIACDKCNKTFTSVQNLRWHMYKLHKAQDEIWVCTICEQLFHDKDEYHEHRESHTASLGQYKRQRLDHEEHSNDDEVMRDEYQRDLNAIDDEAAVNLTMEQDESSNEETRPSSNPSFTAIKQALAAKPPSAIGVPISRNNKRKRKGNPIKHVITGNASESEEELVFPHALDVETVSANSPVPSVESDNDPLQHSYSSDVLASSSMSQCSRFSEQEPTDHLQSLQALTHIRSPLVIRPDGSDLSPLSLPRSSELLYSPSPVSSLHSNNNNNNIEDLSTPDRKGTPLSLQNTPNTPVDDGDDENDYTCSYDGCTEPCHGFRLYETHCVSTHSRYPCKLCKQTFSGKNNRTRHMRNHNRAKIYPCPDCGKYFSRPDSMREHRFIHTASYQEDKCRRCNQEFQRKSLLLAHLKNCFRTARTKNGSIDESPYMHGGDHENNNDTSTLMKAELHAPSDDVLNLKTDSAMLNVPIMPALSPKVLNLKTESPITLMPEPMRIEPEPESENLVIDTSQPATA